MKLQKVKISPRIEDTTAVLLILTVPYAVVIVPRQTKLVVCNLISITKLKFHACGIIIISDSTYMHTYIIDILGSLKLPPIIEKRGHPKGAEKTAIGLPSRKRFKGDQVRKPVSFLKKSTSNKD